ncbi:hypothetical protein D3C72_1624130 [compost metagenome]
MSDTAKEPPTSRAQQLNLVLRVAGEVPRVGHEEFDLLFAKPDRQLLPVALVEADADRRVSLDEFRQRLGHQHLGRVRAAAEVQLATGQAVVLRQFVVQGLAAGEQAPGMLQHQFTLARQAEFAAAAFYQRAVEVALQGLDAATEGGLAEVDRLGGTAEVAVIGQGDKVAELS